jgi:ureidoacrylate peracid hydrolase
VRPNAADRDSGGPARWKRLLPGITATQERALCDNNAELLMRLDQKIDPEHCALVVIDVQNDFAASGGFFDKVGADLKPIQTERVPALLRLIAAARKAGVLVIFVQAIYDPEYLSGPMRERNARLGMEMPRCLTGSWGADFFEVRPEAGEPVVIKHRYSAMTSTEFRGILEERKIRSLLLTGIATDTCVESLGRDAYFIDYYVTVVADCCGAASEQDHVGALRRFSRDYGQVVESSEVAAIWNAGCAAAGQPVFASVSN